MSGKTTFISGKLLVAIAIHRAMLRMLLAVAITPRDSLLGPPMIQPMTMEQIMNRSMKRVVPPVIYDFASLFSAIVNTTTATNASTPSKEIGLANMPASLAAFWCIKIPITSGSRRKTTTNRAARA